MALFQIQWIELAVFSTFCLFPCKLHDVIIPGLWTNGPHVIVHSALWVYKHLLPAVSKQLRSLYTVRCWKPPLNLISYRVYTCKRDQLRVSDSDCKVLNQQQWTNCKRKISSAQFSLPSLYFGVGDNMSSWYCNGVIRLPWRSCIHDNRVRGYNGCSPSIIHSFKTEHSYKKAIIQWKYFKASDMQKSL